MKKILLVRSEKSSSWVSCNVIAENLLASYRLLGEEFAVELLDLPESFDENFVDQFEVIRDCAARVRKFKPDYFVFLDHLPLPPVILKLLLTVDPQMPLGDVIVHVYGDFTYYLEHWCEFFKGFEDFRRIKFVAASKSQARMLTYLLGSHASIIQGYFPVTSSFVFDEGVRRTARKAYRATDEEKLLVYAGRISVQKNVDLLLRAFSELCDRSPEKKLRLLIAGHYDNVGCKFSSLEVFEGYQFQKIQETLAELSEGARASIEFLGGLGREDLNALYQAADGFVSLSLYHDEDYGMAVAEALAAGAPAVISDWGGYSSFAAKDGRWSCDLVPVNFEKHEYSFSLSEALDRIGAALALSDAPEARLQRARAFVAEFDARNFSRILREIIFPAPVSSKICTSRADRYLLISDYTVWEKGKEMYNHYFSPKELSLYNEIYSNYVGSERI